MALALAIKFKECVALDLKFYKGKIFLHMVDNAARLSDTVVIQSKNHPVLSMLLRSTGLHCI